MRWRPMASLGAALLTALAAIVANEDGDADIVPFFVGLTVAAGVHAWALTQPHRWARAVAGALAGGWIVAALWIGVLLVMYQSACACSSPPRPPEETYLGLTATVYHLVGLYGGGALVGLATLLPAADQRRS